MKTYFVLVKLYQIFLALHSHYPVDTAYRVGFDLDNSLTRWKRIIFKILKNSQFAKFAKIRMKTHFFLGKLYPKYSLLYTVITLVILNAEFGLIWTNPWPDEKELFLKFSKFAIREIRKNPYENPFFPGQSIPKILFALHCYYTGYTQCRVWFDLDKSLTRWKRIIFKILKIRNSANSQNSAWKPIFFPGKLYQQLFSSAVSLHWWYSMPSLVRFGQLLNPVKKTYF